MPRLVLTDQDLTKQTIEGQPFSYIGRCTGTDIKFVGDWTHVSHFANDFLRPDWSKAKTRYSYSRFNTFTDIIASPDAELLDHEMIRALLDVGRAYVVGPARGEIDRMVVVLDEDRNKEDFLVSWNNEIPPFVAAMKDEDAAAVAFRAVVGGREHLVRHMLKMASANPKDVAWEADEEPYIGHWGVAANNWGVKAVSRDGKKYLKRFHELPIPKNNHDRVAMAELVEAEVEKAVGFPATLNIVSILPWRATATYGKKPRDWWVR